MSRQHNSFVTETPGQNNASNYELSTDTPVDGHNTVAAQDNPVGLEVIISIYNGRP